jgi:hypothetical protein
MNMKIDWKTAFANAIGAVIAAGFLALIGYIQSVVAGNPQALFWVWIGLVISILFFLLALTWRMLHGFLNVVGRWMIKNWQLVVGLLLLFSVTYNLFILMQSFWSIVFTLGLTLAIVLITRSFFLIKSPSKNGANKFQVISLPIGKVANAYLEGKYQNLPLGEVEFGGVNFFLKSGASVFDTSKARFIDPDDCVRVKLELPEPAIQVKSVHLLINAGGGWRIHPDSKKVFEWLKIGKVILGFEDNIKQTIELILGDNIREWAIGNFPGQLVDRVADPLCQVAWRSTTPEGKYAVIDRLEIPILETHKNKKLEYISFVRDIGRHTPPQEGGSLHFFVSAVTLEFEQ